MATFRQIFNSRDPELHYFPEDQHIILDKRTCQLLEINHAEFETGTGESGVIIGISKYGLILDSGFIWKVTLTPLLLSVLIGLSSNAAKYRLAQRVMAAASNFSDKVDYSLIEQIVTEYLGYPEDWNV